MKTRRPETAQTLGRSRRDRTSGRETPTLDRALRRDRHLGGGGRACAISGEAKNPAYAPAAVDADADRGLDERARPPSLQRRAGRPRVHSIARRCRRIVAPVMPLSRCGPRRDRAMTAVPAIAPRGAAAAAPVRPGLPMLSVYVPRGTSLERRVGRGRRRGARRRGLDRPRQRRRSARTSWSSALLGIARADARGDAGDRGLQPALCRERRALHDRDADVPVRHRDAQDHAGHLHPRPAIGWSPCATTSRARS